MKLKRKIFLIFSLIAIIPMCFLTTYTVYQYTEIIDTRVEDIANEQQQNSSGLIFSGHLHRPYPCDHIPHRSHDARSGYNR